MTESSPHPITRHRISSLVPQETSGSERQEKEAASWEQGQASGGRLGCMVSLPHISLKCSVRPCVVALLRCCGKGGGSNSVRCYYISHILHAYTFCIEEKQWEKWNGVLGCEGHHGGTSQAVCSNSPPSSLILYLGLLWDPSRKPPWFPLSCGLPGIGYEFSGSSQVCKHYHLSIQGPSFFSLEVSLAT